MTGGNGIGLNIANQPKRSGTNRKTFWVSSICVARYTRRVIARNGVARRAGRRSNLSRIPATRRFCHAGIRERLLRHANPRNQTLFLAMTRFMQRATQVLKNGEAFSAGGVRGSAQHFVEGFFGERFGEETGNRVVAGPLFVAGQKGTGAHENPGVGPQQLRRLGELV